MHVKSFRTIDHLESEEIIIEEQFLIHGIPYITRKFDSIFDRSK